MNGKKRGHPDHSDHLKNLNRIRGQIDGIENMILDRRYCPDIVNQLRAAEKALQSIEMKIIETHLQSCLVSAIASKNGKSVAKKIDEMMDLVKR